MLNDLINRTTTLYKLKLNSAKLTFFELKGLMKKKPR